MQYGQTVGNTSFTRTAAQVEEQGAGDLEESPLPTPVMIPREDVDTTVVREGGIHRLPTPCILAT
jgi:hypothetical protein